MSLVNAESFVGKTIQSVDTSAANQIILTFTDGTSVRLEVEAVGHGFYGIVEH